MAPSRPEVSFFKYNTVAYFTFFSVNKVTDVAISPSPEGTVDTLTLALTIDDIFTGEQRRNELLIEKLQAKMLLEELKKIYKNMECVEPEQGNV